MIDTVLILVLAALCAVAVGFASRRVLGTPVGRVRSVVVGLLVFATGLPFGVWVSRTTGVVSAGRVAGAGDAWIAVVTIGLAMAWVFAAGVGLLVALELFWPTTAFRNPVDVVRGALRSRRRTNRYLEILGIASRHGLGWVFHSRPRLEQQSTTAQQRAQAIIETINASGVTFVKLGQVLSTRRDLVPEPYLSALASLQSGATTLPWEIIRAEIAAELGRPIDEVFAFVEESPLAAASVAQVHAARLLDGQDVVIKVQRPTARAQVEADVDIVLRLAESAELHTRQGRDLRAVSVARGFTSTLLDELDYRIEYSNTEMIRATLVAIAEHAGPDDVRITIPRVHSSASSARMITMDRVDGSPLSRAEERLGRLSDDERSALAADLMNVVLEQILVHGVFHADLHPGNVILREDGTLGLIDFGAIGIIERSQREYLAALLLAAASEDDIAATDALLLIVDLPDDADLDAFRHDIGQVLTRARYQARGHGSIFAMMLDVIRQHRIALPATLSSAFRSFATLEGCLQVLVADFDLMEHALERVPELMKRMLTLRRIAASAQAQAAVGAAYARRIPRRLESLSERLEQGTLGVRLRTFAEPGDRGFVGGLVAEVVAVLISLTAVVLAIVLVVSDSGPTLAPGLGLFDLGGAFIGLLGFLGVLRVVRRLLRAP